MATTTSALEEFSTFVLALRETRLPGASDQRLLKQIYSLAGRKAYLETRGIQSIQTAAEKQRPRIAQWTPVFSALKLARASLVEAQRRCEEMYPDPVYWRDRFGPAQGSVLEISRSVKSIRQRSIDPLHSRSLKKGETKEWEPLLYPQHDYPLDRVGWKPVETWFLEELNKLIAQHFSKLKRKPLSKERERLIQAIFVAAFRDRKDCNAIKIAIKRIERRKNRSLVK